MERGVEVNPAILVWAREKAGLDLEQAAHDLNIRTSHLEKVERGETDGELSRSLFKKIVRVYRQPPLAFYLSAPPKPDEYEVEFRKIYESAPRQHSVLVESLIRDAWVRQSMVKFAMETEEAASPVSFVGSLSIGDGIERAVDVLATAIGGPQTLMEYHGTRRSDAAFRGIRKRVEESGVFVILKGNLGNHHSNIPIEEFRGLAISDVIAPFIFINPMDSQPARTFTLMHEMVHVLLGKNSISRDIYQDRTVESYCNQVASNYLLPEQALSDLSLRGNPGTEEQLQSIARFAGDMNLSGTMVAYRVFREGRIDHSNFRTLQNQFRSLWLKNRADTASSKGKGEIPYYTVRRSQLGGSLIEFTRRMLDMRAISTSKAARILDVGPIGVGEVLNPAREN